MHNMKKLILSVFIFTFGCATATHAQQEDHVIGFYRASGAPPAFGINS